MDFTILIPTFFSTQYTDFEKNRRGPTPDIEKLYLGLASIR